MADPQRGLGRLTLILTNAIKIAGLVVALRTAFAPHPQIAVLGVSAFMMAGAQFGEGTILALLDRFLGRVDAPTLPPPEEKRRSKR